MHSRRPPALRHKGDRKLKKPSSINKSSSGKQGRVQSQDSSNGNSLSAGGGAGMTSPPTSTGSEAASKRRKKGKRQRKLPLSLVFGVFVIFMIFILLWASSRVIGRSKKLGTPANMNWNNGLRAKQQDNSAGGEGGSTASDQEWKELVNKQASKGAHEAAIKALRAQ